MSKSNVCNQYGGADGGASRPTHLQIYMSRTHVYFSNLSICHELINSGGGGDDGAPHKSNGNFFVYYERIYMPRTYPYADNFSIQVVEEMMELLDKSNGNVYVTNSYICHKLIHMSRTHLYVTRTHLYVSRTHQFRW